MAARNGTRGHPRVGMRSSKVAKGEIVDGWWMLFFEFSTECARFQVRGGGYPALLEKEVEDKNRQMGWKVAASTLEKFAGKAGNAPSVEWVLELACSQSIVRILSNAAAGNSASSFLASQQPKSRRA